MQIQRKMQRAWQRKAAMAALTVVTAASCGTGYAMPQNGEVKAGSAEINTSDNTMNVNQTSQKVAIDWKGFDIAKLETVNFNQPNATAIALNRVTGSKGSEIYGYLHANGQVFLINPNGVLFGKGAEVNVGGLIATTHNINNDDFMNSKGSYTFTGDSANQVKNEGTIKAEGGLVALLAADTANEGTIRTNKGTTALGAGQSMTIDYENDGKINFAVNKSIANAKALNSGSIQANGGYVVMTARDASTTLNTVVNNTGTIEAKSLKNVNGQIVLDGGTNGVVEMSGVLNASVTEAGEEAGESGGTIEIKGKYISIDGTDAEHKAELNVDGAAAGGTITTTADSIVVGQNTKVSAAASDANGTPGTWNINSKNTATISDQATTMLNQLKAAQSKAETARAEADKAAQDAAAKKEAAEKAAQAVTDAQKKLNDLTQQAADKAEQNKDDAAKLQAAKDALEQAQADYNTKQSAADAAADKAAVAKARQTRSINMSRQWPSLVRTGATNGVRRN